MLGASDQPLLNQTAVQGHSHVGADIREAGNAVAKAGKQNRLSVDILGLRVAFGQFVDLHYEAPAVRLVIGKGGCEMDLISRAAAEPLELFDFLDLRDGVLDGFFTPE